MPPAGPAPGGLAALGTLSPVLQRLARLQDTSSPRPAEHPRQAAPEGSLDDGRDAADAAVDEGVDLLLLDPAAEPAGALAALAALLGVEPVAAVGTTGGPGWAGLVGGVRTALPRLRGLTADPSALLAALDDPAVTGATGLVAQAARRRTPVLLGSSPVAAAAVLLAERLAPGTAAWCVAGCSAAAPAARHALTELGLVPVLDLRLPGPGGALLADRLLRAALELLDG